MSLQEFKASLPASNESSGGKTEEQIKNSDTKGSNLRPPSGKAKSSQDKLSTKPTDGGKLLRDKQIEERKKKNEQRKAAVEDRRKQKELEDSVKNTALRQLLEHKGGPPGAKTTGRKLPNVPGNTSYPRRETSATRRLSSSSSSSDSTGHTPPGSGKHTRNTRRNLTGPSSASTSSLNSFGSNLGKPQTNLGASKKTSVSTNNLNDKTLGAAKTGQRVKEKGAGVQSRRSAGSVLPKAQSMGAIHQVGTKTSSSRPQSGKKPKPKQVHHAGTASEAEAKQALAERRKRIREVAERKALLDKEKQEELRRQREEEEKRLAEENAKEMARQAELAKQLQEQEKERAKLLQEQREKDAEIEAEKLVAEAKRKEELEVLRKQEMERRAKEAEKREKEEEERLKREEIERQERRKRVEMIMSRTRLTSTVNTNMNNAESYSSLEDLSVKLSDEHHSSTVSDILQKVKEKSRATSPISPEQQKENQQFLENAGKESLDGKNENSNDVLRPIDNSKNTEVMAPTRA